MNHSPTIRLGSQSRLSTYVASQLNALFPTGDEALALSDLDGNVPGALERMRPILRSVRAFEESTFDHLHSMQYATFLYLLANEVWRSSGQKETAERLYCLNRALNSIDLFYAVALPEVFLIAHGLGTVLGNVSYGQRFVVFQNVTVGRLGEARPAIGENVILFPGATVTGNTTIGDNSVVAAGTVLHDVVVPADVVVRMRDGCIEQTPRTRNYADLYFRAAC